MIPPVRPVRHPVIGALIDLAGRTVNGMTNLPRGRNALAGTIDRTIFVPNNEFYMSVD